MRMTWLKFVACVSLAICFGCAHGVDTEAIVDDELGADTIVVPVEPTPDVPATPTSIAVEAAPDTYSELIAWLGTSNTISVKEPFTIDRSDVSVTIPANATMSYVTSDSASTFTFAKPLPIVTAKVFGLKIHPNLSSILIRPDGSGVASTSYGKKSFRWVADDEDAGAASTESLPEVWAYECGGFCNVTAKNKLARAKKEFADAEKAGTLKYKVVWKPGDQAPSWMKPDRPAFWWDKVSNQPDDDKRGSTIYHYGYDGIDDFNGRWKKTRVEPKKAESARAGSATPFFAKSKPA